MLRKDIESQLFNTFGNRYNQWLPVIKLIHAIASFKLVILGLTPVSLLESDLGFEIATHYADTGKRPSSHV
jgi:hypothetical protein